MKEEAGSMAGHGTRRAVDRDTSGRQARSGRESFRKDSTDVLVTLVNRLLLAQAGASAAVSLSFSRKNVPSVLIVLGVAAVLCGLAGLVRSGSHLAWLAAVMFESGYVVVGLVRFAFAPYLGGTLLAIVALGTMLHPTVAARFASARAGRPGQRRFVGPGWPGDLLTAPRALRPRCGLLR
jgi:hypothetical protein